MRGICLFLIFLMIGIHTAGAQSIITIDVHENGSATWTLEKWLPLANQTDINDWEEFIRTGQAGNQEDLNDFIKRMDWFVESAQKFSGRQMKVEGFNISYGTAKTPPNAYGIIIYSFEWKNFSHKENGKISIGDSFAEGMVLSQDNVLILKIPDGYEVESASPAFDKRDGSRLIWDGSMYRNFVRGEPAVVLASSGINPWFFIVILIVLAAGAFFIVFRRKNNPNTQSDTVSPENMAIEDLKYENTITEFLVRSGGEASQSDIIKEIGLSKSRVSTILSQMKAKGGIIKIKNGKGNLIRMVK